VGAGGPHRHHPWPRETISVAPGGNIGWPSTLRILTAGHDAPGINSRAVLEDEWYAAGETNKADGDTIRALKVICSAASLMNAVIQSNVPA
jgi:hypothetical protein